MTYDQVSRRLRACITQTDKQAFFASIFCSLLGYLYFGVHLTPNHDGVLQFYFKDAATFTSGRWAQAALSSMSTLYTPWLLLAIGLLALAVSTVFLVRLFQLKRFLPILAAAAALSLNPTMISQVLYLYTLDGYFLAMALCAAAVYVTERYRLGVCGGILLLAVAMGEYQAYLCFVIAIFAIRLLQKILQNQTTNKELLVWILKYAGLLVGGLVTYLVINKLVLGLLHLSMSNYQGMSKMGQISLMEILRGVRAAYRAFFPYFWGLTREICGNITAVAAMLVLALIFLTGIGLLVKRKKRPVFQILLALGALLALPVLTNSIYLMGSQSVYLVMTYPLCFVYVLGCVLAEELIEAQATSDAGSGEKTRLHRGKTLATSLCSWATLLCTVFISLAWGVAANESATIVEAKNLNMYSLCTRLVDRMEQYPGYDREATPVAFIGSFVDNPSFSETKPYFQKDLELIGWALSNDYTFLSNEKRLSFYITEFIGVNVNRATDAIPGIRETEQYKQMPCFPQDGSLAFIGDVLVVKLSMQ